CRDGSPSSSGVKPAVRFRVPVGGTTKFLDAVFGEREFSNDEIEDFVLVRSGKDDDEFGQAMYQMSVVVDDVDMRITHVIRGADHISNTPKQVLLYRALGAALPVFAHVPLILGADKSRLSKRHGATDVNLYRTEGFLPEALRNFLGLLGWVSAGRRSAFSWHCSSGLPRAMRNPSAPANYSKSFPWKASAAPTAFSTARSLNGSTPNICRSCRWMNSCAQHN